MLFQKQAGIALIDNLTLVYDYARLTAIDDVLYIVAGGDCSTDKSYIPASCIFI